MPGVIHKVLGRSPYLVRCDRKIRYCHTDHLLRRHADIPQAWECEDSAPSLTWRREGIPLAGSQVKGCQSGDFETGDGQSVGVQSAGLKSLKAQLEEKPMQGDRGIESPGTGQSDQGLQGAAKDPEPPRGAIGEHRYPMRQRKAPDRLDL